MKKRGWVAGITISILVVVVLVSRLWGGEGDPDARASAPEATPPAVRTLVIEPAVDTLVRQFFGRVRARETVDLAFEVGGTLRRLLPDEGTRVRQGELLAELRLDPFERAVARAELQLELATREADRARRLAETAAAPTSGAADAETARGLADVALADARAALEDASLRAPFDGLVSIRMAATHASVSPGEPVIRLHDLSEVRVEVEIPERLFLVAGGLDAGGLGAGGVEAIRFEALARAPGSQGVPLRLVAFQAETDRVGQSYRITLAFPPGAGTRLVPGASITVRAGIPAGRGGTPVPAEALVASNGREAQVLLVEDRGGTLVVRLVPVTLGAPSGSGFVVEGIPPGAEIVAAGAHHLRDGQAVRRFARLVVED